MLILLVWFVKVTCLCIDSVMTVIDLLIHKSTWMSTDTVEWVTKKQYLVQLMTCDYKSE